MTEGIEDLKFCLAACRKKRREHISKIKTLDLEIKWLHAEIRRKRRFYAKQVKELDRE